MLPSEGSGGSHDARRCVGSLRTVCRVKLRGDVGTEALVMSGTVQY